MSTTTKPAALSKLLRRKIIDSRLSGTRQYQLARRARIDPAMLSKWLHGAVPVTRGDIQVIRLGRELGLTPEQCFAPEVLSPRPRYNTAHDETAA